MGVFDRAVTCVAFSKSVRTSTVWRLLLINNCILLVLVLSEWWHVLVCCGWCQRSHPVGLELAEGEAAGWSQGIHEFLYKPRRNESSSSRLLSLQCSNDSVLAAVFHPMDDNLIVTCGKSHINFWTVDSNTLVKRQGLFEVTSRVRPHCHGFFRRIGIDFCPSVHRSVLLFRNTRSQSTCYVWPLLRMETPSRETPVETSTSGPEVDLKSVQ